MKCSPLGRVNSLTFFWSSWNSWAFLGGSWRSCADTSRPAERIREQRSRPRTIDNSFGQREVPTAFKRIASPSGGGVPLKYRHDCCLAGSFHIMYSASAKIRKEIMDSTVPVSYTHLRAHETVLELV